MDKELLKKWILSIPRKDFQPTKSSKVCELHFKEDDIEKETYEYDNNTDEKISAPCREPREQLVIDKELAVEDIYKLTSDLNRGSLHFPNSDVIRVISLSFIISQKLLSPDYEGIFLKE